MHDARKLTKHDEPNETIAQHFHLSHNVQYLRSPKRSGDWPWVNRGNGDAMNACFWSRMVCFTSLYHEKILLLPMDDMCVELIWCSEKLCFLACF